MTRQSITSSLKDPLAKPAGAKSLIDSPDPDYYAQLQHLMPILTTAPSDMSDHIAAREWLKKDWTRLPRVVQAPRFQPPVSCRTEEITITHNVTNAFRIRVYRPDGLQPSHKKLSPALIVLHGGGWIHGSLDTDDETCKYFCSELRAVIINVDYRLAPEHPFPAAHDDVYETLNWIISNAEKYSIDPRKIAMWGCSAGANLAAGVALRDSDSTPSRIAYLSIVVLPACHPAYFPRKDDSSSESQSEAKLNASQPLMDVWTKYAGDSVGHKYVAVLTVEPTQLHPPTYITVAAQDLLADQGIAYHLHLRNAGLDCQLSVVPGVPHGIYLVPNAAVVHQFWRDQTRALMWGLGVMSDGQKENTVLATNPCKH